MHRLPSGLCLAFAGLVVTVGCRDGPSTAPALDGLEPPPVVLELTPSLQLVSQLPFDPFAQPLFHKIIGQNATNQLGAILNSFALFPTDQTLSDAVLSLTDVQRQIQYSKKPPASSASLTDEPEEAEVAVIQDALGLVVDDALSQLLNVTDSTGG